MKKNNTKNSNGIFKIFKMVLSIFLGLCTGPFELLWIKVIGVEEKNFQIFWLIFAIFIFSIIYLVILFILNKLLHRNDDDKCWLIMRILAPISIFVMWFIIGKINAEGNIASIIFSILFMIPNIFFFVPSGSSNSTSKKIRATTWNFGSYKETTYRDENGNKVGEASSLNWGPVTDTTIKDKNGNKTKIERWKL